MPQAKIGVIGGTGLYGVWYRTIDCKSAIIGGKVNLIMEGDGENKGA